jgi:hypothetical protein
MRIQPALKNRRLAVVGTAACLLAAAGPASACLDLGVYQDDPVPNFNQLTANVGPALNTVSVYITAGTGLDPQLVKLAQKRKLKLLVTWAPDNGTETKDQPGFANADVSKGKFDKSLAALSTQMAQTGLQTTMRIMPEANAPWYAWSGNVNGNTPASYVSAFQHAVTVVRKTTRGKVKVLWAPYARSIPEAPENGLDKYYPGAKWIDFAGASGHNFGAIPASSAWKDPAETFGDAYKQIQGLGAKPFYITETGSTGTGGDKAGWIAALGKLPAALPQLKGVTWYDQADPLGDFRVRSGSPETLAFRSLVKTQGCKPAGFKPVTKKKTKVTKKGKKPVAKKAAPKAGAAVTKKEG